MNAEKFIIVYEDEVPVAVLEHAYNIIAVSEVNSESYLEFDLHFTDAKRKYLNNQAEVRIGGEAYKIKTVRDKKEADSKVTHVYAENLYYDLARVVKKDRTVFDTAKAVSAMNFAVQGTKWSVGKVEITITRSFECDENNPLAVLQLIAEVYVGELVFHSVEKIVDLVAKTGTDNGVVFHFSKNMKSIERTIDTANLMTKLYAVGKDGMTFAKINDGLSFIEDYSYTDEVLVGTLDGSSITDMNDLLDYTKTKIGEFCRPSYSYSLSVMYLKDRKGFAHEGYSLGDVVRVWDEELGIDIKTRIIRLERDIMKPWNTKVELSTTIGTLSLAVDSSVSTAIDAVLKSFVAPRLMQATINTTTGEINALYELGVPVKYTFTETENGIVFTHPDGLTCEITVI